MFSFRSPLCVIAAGSNLLYQQTRVWVFSRKNLWHIGRNVRSLPPVRKADSTENNRQETQQLHFLSEKKITINTFILKRKWPPPLHKKGGKPSKLRARHFVYDLVEDTNVSKQPDVKVILNQFVDGVGNAGDVLNLRPTTAYRDYLVPGLAMYASPENLAKYKVDENRPKAESGYSSPYVQRTLGCLSRLVLQITMSKTQPWTLEPWHVRVSFRKAGFVVPEHAITMPPVTIKGPDLSLQEKEFIVTVKVNNKEEVNVRCRIHHWATGLERLPWVSYHWKEAKEALILEQAPVLENLPLPK